MRGSFYLDNLKYALSSGNFFGFGLGTYEIVANQLPYIKTGVVGHVITPWNDYLGCMTSLGASALGVILGLFYYIGRTFRFLNDEEKALMCSLSIIPIGCFFHSFISFVNTGILCLVILAIYQIRNV
jgi:hypothetical protein